MRVFSNGNAALQVGAVSITGPYASDFAVATDPCSSQLLPVRASCTMELTFKPGAKGARTATLSVPSNDAYNPVDTVALSGTGIVRADVAVALQATPNPVKKGANVTYSAKVTNGGPTAASSVRLNNTIPPGTQLVSKTIPAGWSCTPALPVGYTGTIACTKSSLASGTTATFTFVAKVVVNGPTTLHNTATVSSSTPDPNSINNTSTVHTSVSGRAATGVS